MISRIGVLLSCCLLVLLPVYPPLARPDSADMRWQSMPYELGQGMHFPAQGLSLGGYLSLRYRDLEDVPSSMSIKDLSLLASLDITDRLNLFTEMEIGEALSLSQDGINTDDAEFEVERLYLDYRVAPEVTFRLGKFLTPVGRWNLIHADPLVWTVSRPLTTSVAFARQASGAMVYGSVPSGANGFDYSLFVDDTDLFDHHQQEERAYDDAVASIAAVGAFEHAAGARIVYHLHDDRIQVGASYLRFRMMDLQENKDLYGLDLFWNTRYAEFSGEWVYRNSRGAVEPDERGGFLQAAIPVGGQLFLIGRYERYHSALEPATAEIETLGLTYRPYRAVSLKLEYRGGDHNQRIAPEGWLGSLAILF